MFSHLRVPSVRRQEGGTAACATLYFRLSTTMRHFVVSFLLWSIDGRLPAGLWNKHELMFSCHISAKVAFHCLPTHPLPVPRLRHKITIRSADEEKRRMAQNVCVYCYFLVGFPRHFTAVVKDACSAWPERSF